MIKRQAPNKATPSAVNTAQNEHFNVTEAIRADAAITSVKSVAKSVNFDNDADGAYVLRKPLILKESLNSKNTWYLYDNESTLNIGTYFNIVSPTGTGHVSVRYYDKTLEYVSTAATTTVRADWIMQVHKVYNAPDHTLLSVTINNAKFNTRFGHDLIYTDLHYDPTMKIYPGEPHATPPIPASITEYKLYRFIKIYKDVDTDVENSWILEIVNPELNTITTGLDVGNPNTLDINLLLDNPYAIRDLYGYGFNSTTKLFTYYAIGLSAEQINALPVYRLTEDLPYMESGIQKGFKLLLSSNAVDLYNQPILLKACLTTALSNLTYYCCWEQSSNGIDWEVCPDFLTKFQSNTTNIIVEKLVSDITSAEFEKIAYDDSLEKAASYLVTKKMVKLNPAHASTDLSETDLIGSRPDILLLTNPNLNLYYRFLVYVDSEKSTPVPETIKKTITKSYFELVLNTDNNLDANGKFIYQAYLGSGVDSDVPSGTTPASKYPEAVGGALMLYESSDSTYLGNYLYIKCTDDSYTLKSLKIVLDNKVFHASDDNHNDSYYTELGTKLKYILDPSTSQIGDVQISGGTATPLINANEGYTITFGTEHSILIGNDSKNLSNTDLGGNKVFQFRTKIKTIEIVYEVPGNIESTSVYLTSSTSNYKIPYSNKTEFLEDLSFNRKQLFTSDIYYNKEQFLFYGNNNVYVSNKGSSIIKFMNTMTFGLAVNAIISYRSYLIAFTDSSITLLKYNSETDAFDSKLLTSSIGVPKVDARTILVILNSIYFKSGLKVYKLIPNLYASTDDVLNITTISTPIDKLLADLISPNVEIGNFTHADATNYMLFIPIRTLEDTVSNTTYMFKYDFSKKLWTLHKYPLLATGIEVRTIKTAYLKTQDYLYYFNEELNILLNQTLLQDFDKVGYHDASENEDVLVGCQYTLNNGDTIVANVSLGNSIYSSLADVYDYIPYGDYLYNTLNQLYQEINSSTLEANNLFENYVTPIAFSIDFGQKSSNYTVDKQFLESKLIFATLHYKDTFPVDLTITTDGIQKPLHWDVNTDSSLWKTSLSDLGTLNTDFVSTNQEYDGIFRQLIVKYSGKGKTIKHVINGLSRTKFKFYSMDVRSRILPVKQ